jgi:hypothetical protein
MTLRDQLARWSEVVRVLREDDPGSGDLVDLAMPGLIAAVQAALDLADQWQASGEQHDQLAEAARTRLDLSSELVHGLTAADLTEHAEALRERITSAFGAHPQVVDAGPT